MGDTTAAWPLLHHAVTVGYETEMLSALMDVLEGVGVLLLADGRTADGVELLQFVRDHSATEGQFVRQAEKALRGFVFEESGISLDGMVTAVLQEMLLV